MQQPSAGSNIEPEQEQEHQRLRKELFFQQDHLRRLISQGKDVDSIGATRARIDDLKMRLKEIEDVRGRPRSRPAARKKTPRVDFLMVTALEEERDAVLSKLPSPKQVPPSDATVQTYFSSLLRIRLAGNSSGVYHVMVIPLLGMGRVQATAATNDAIHQWHPRYVILVGIAGGIAAKGVQLGDVLISDQVVDYELQKQTYKGSQVRWEVYRASPRLVGAARNLRDNWKKLIAVERPDGGAPKRHIGPIASGDKVVAFNKILTKYRRAWPALMGVEMEAAGVAAASFQAVKPPGFFMVRGVSDLADGRKNSSRVARWRTYACDVAASYAIALLKSGPVKAMLSRP